MKEKFINFIEKFYKFMETKQFDPENEDDRKIVQKRINMMMESPQMKKWLSQNIQFGKDEHFTNEVLMYLIDCATDLYEEKEFIKKFYRATPEALLASALKHIKILESLKFYNTKVSVKASNVQLAIDSYKLLAKETNYPLHLGITEAGGLFTGSIKSSIGLGCLLLEGIGDTIRVSLSSDPVNEVKVGYEILKSLGLRHRGVQIISCPSCARQGFDVISTVQKLEERLSHIKTPMSLSIIGCVVNGPGEALMTDVGFTGGGAGSGMVYLAGKASHKMSNEEMIDHIVQLVEKKVRN